MSDRRLEADQVDDAVDYTLSVVLTVAVVWNSVANRHALCSKSS